MKDEDAFQARFLDGAPQLIVVGDIERIALRVQPAGHEHTQALPAHIMHQAPRHLKDFVYAFVEVGTMGEEHDRVIGDLGGDDFKDAVRRAVAEEIPVEAIVDGVHSLTCLGRELRNRCFVGCARMLGWQNPFVALKQESGLHRLGIDDASQRDNCRFRLIDERENQPAIVAVVDIGIGNGVAHIAHGIGNMVNRREIGFGVGLFEPQRWTDFHILVPLERRHRPFAPRREYGHAMAQLAEMQRHLFELRLPAAHGKVGE